MVKFKNEILVLKIFLVLGTLLASLIFISSVQGGKQAGLMALYVLFFGGGMSLFTIAVVDKKFKNWYLVIFIIPIMILIMPVLLATSFMLMFVLFKDSLFQKNIWNYLLKGLGLLIPLVSMIFGGIFFMVFKKAGWKINQIKIWYVVYILWVVFALIWWQSFAILSILIGFPAFLAVFIFDRNKTVLKKIAVIIITILQFIAIFYGLDYFKKLRDPCYDVQYGEKGPRWHIKDDRVCVGQGAVYIKYHTLKGADASTFRETKEHYFQDKNHRYDWNWEIIE